MGHLSLKLFARSYSRYAAEEICFLLTFNKIDKLWEWYFLEYSISAQEQKETLNGTIIEEIVTPRVF